MMLPHWELEWDMPGVGVKQPTLFENSESNLGDSLPSTETASVRYLGSKSRLARSILEILGNPNDQTQSFVDGFSGTGIVSRLGAIQGWNVNANDHLISAATLTRASLTSASDAPFQAFGGYDSAIRELNAAPYFEGFISREYAPSGLSQSGHLRKYFTVENAQRIDGMRKCIREWSEQQYLNTFEHGLLVADLLIGSNGVANTAGTYGCYLRRWSNSAVRPIQLFQRNLVDRTGSVVVTNLDVFDVVTRQNDVLYLDPPYTKRQYAAYYHIMETITENDWPAVSGVTGLRPWQHKSSSFCYKRRALPALTKLVDATNASRILISYSSEGHIPLVDLKFALEKIGQIVVHDLDTIGRYRSNNAASENGTDVEEFLIEVIKSTCNKGL